jgi:DNA (cytosine-5)-methyltransferase 1
VRQEAPWSILRLIVPRGRSLVLSAEYISQIEPKVFLIENVRQVTTKYDDVLKDFVSVLDDDYSISHRILDSADYVVPQHRIRAFIIGIKDQNILKEHKKPKFPRPTHGPDSDSNSSLVTAGDALEEIPEPSDKQKYKVKSKHAHLLEDIPPSMNYSFYTDKMGHPEPKFEWRSKFSDYLYKTDPQKPVRTLKAKPGAASGPFHWENRRFTEKELMRLQTFPRKI